VLAIVNIVTRHPRDVESAYASVDAGTNASIVAARAAFKLSPSAISATVSRTQNCAYDVLTQEPNGHDSLRVNRPRVRSQTQVSNGAGAIAVNHQYRFAPWRWGRVAVCLLLFGSLLKLAASLR